jgi:hypothetical protein
VKKLILTIMGVVLSLLSFNVTAGKMSEGDYVDKICKGSIEYTLDNKTRVDCQLSNPQPFALLELEVLVLDKLLV